MSNLALLPTFIEEDEGIELDLTQDVATLKDTMEVTKAISTIRLIEKQVEHLELQDQQSRAFYADKKARCSQRIEDIKRSIMGYLQQNGLKNIQTPVGTAYQRTVILKQWPADESLIAWAETNKPEAIRLKKEPDKRMLTDHFKTMGEIPEGYAEESEVRLYIK